MELFENDKIARILFKPYHYRNNKLSFSAFVPPRGRYDVSVNIIKLTTKTFLCNKGKNMEKGNKKLTGLGEFYYKDFLKFNCFNKITLDKNNISDPSHGNIITNYTKGSISPEVRLQLKKFVNLLSIQDCN